MKTIRKSVFETNSSSSHSITVSVAGDHGYVFDKFATWDGEFSEVTEDDRGMIVTLLPGEFGWGVQIYDSPSAKASYLLTHLLNYEDDERVQEFLELLTEHTSQQVTYRELNDEFYPKGYIDHQSYSVSADLLARGNDMILKYIFDDSYKLIIDNDNH